MGGSYVCGCGSMTLNQDPYLAGIQTFFPVLEIYLAYFRLADQETERGRVSGAKLTH